MAGIFLKSICALILIFPFSTSGVHPYYVSVTEIGYKESDKLLEVSIKIFTDDFEKALRKKYKSHVDLLAAPNDSIMNKIVKEYIQDHLAVNLEEKQPVLQYLGYEKDEDGIRSYFEAKEISPFKTIRIKDNILYEFSSQQESIIHVTVNGVRKSTRLLNPEDKVTFTF